MGKGKYTRTEIEQYYNNFNEDNRLNTRHGIVEYKTTMHYIKSELKEGMKIIDIGAGTGKYSVTLSNMGYDVTAVELVPHNVEIIRSKRSNANVVLGNALDLSRFEDELFDITLLFGPMYHLLTENEKIQALSEAKRVTKKGGKIFVAYYMNEYGVVTYGFKKQNILDSLNDGRLDESFHVHPQGNDLYDMVRIEDIDKLNQKVDLKRIKIIASDGPANYLRPFLNDMSEEMFEQFLNYHLKTCERLDLIGASGHTVDILCK